MPNTTLPSVRFVRLGPAVFEALLAGDLATARTLTGVALSDWFLSDEVDWLWRMRLLQIAADPSAEDWVVRAAVTVPDGVAVGTGGFHGPPDAAGVVEMGYATDPAFRRRGYARAMVAALLDWAAAEPLAITVRATISPDNEASLATIAGYGFVHVGEQQDEQDDTEYLYERPTRSTG
ncbi:GNAT family N-acetyltransferase [Actinokineospora diospyrosa]|uniref:Protein N-acetyltransferase, RimJ/RimL family n=1 Tax=Actinokineospora diospyrosa TaxID=103728 RepID=A0ABT1IE56_9PSEU|nr:GNAT family N-acetyltransferase [Actinokineospora diospyrosa]MCP2270844.1 Protein N-acetyltransferase, RimJ/RimL family [Actinokineospora diospyrosa]